MGTRLPAGTRSSVSAPNSRHSSSDGPRVTSAGHAAPRSASGCRASARRRPGRERAGHPVIRDGPDLRSGEDPVVAFGPPRTERSHRGLVRRFAKPLSGVTCFEGSNPSLSASTPLAARARSSADRASGCGPEGREFESRRARQPRSNADPTLQAVADTPISAASAVRTRVAALGPPRSTATRAGTVDPCSVLAYVPVRRGGRPRPVQGSAI